MMLILPIHEHDICFTYLYLCQFLPSVSYDFLSMGILPPWLNLFLGTLLLLLFFVAIINGIPALPECLTKQQNIPLEIGRKTMRAL